MVNYYTQTEFTLWKRCESCGVLSNCRVNSCRACGLYFMRQALTEREAPGGKVEIV